uniref:Fc receptor-like protein 5 n=1 Tax=Gasterosteus aculeatus aculeatus TaxID=481459 RepID=UPI001A9989D9|nr:Fc receptor-like protein 5 [Gasterosteus aculeatus aculeatus]
MGQTLFGVLGLWLLNILYCGHAQDALLHIEPNRSTLFTKETVTFICDPGDAKDTYWSYLFRRNGAPITTQTQVNRYKLSPLSKGNSGEYQCVAHHKITPFVTRESNKVSLTVSDALLHIEPNWSPLFTGETVAFICDPGDGNDTDWSYLFRRNGYTFTTERHNRYTSPSLSKGDSGEYQCVAHHKFPPYVTRESNKVSLTVSDVPRPVLTVSPSWTSPGGSVTLTCSVEPPSAGWRFFWYQAAHKLSLDSYTYELLPGITTGTEQDSYILHGQTHTPHRLQHFSTESLTLSCEGTSTEWRVMWMDEDGITLSCSDRWKMTGSTCNTDTAAMSGVYWCESETQFSNAVNITIHSGDVILVSPVRPVTEGHSVTLGCKLRTENLLYNVDFYKNDKLIPNPSRGELLISAVKESDEGFYKCSGSKSPQGLENVTSAASWLSVKYPEETASSSVFPVLLVVGLISGVLLTLVLLFLRRYRKSKGSRVSRSQRTNQSPATDHMINQGDTQDGHYAPLQPGDSCLYEMIEGSEEPKHGTDDEPDENIYANVTMETAADG